MYDLSTVLFALGLTVFAGLSTCIGGAIAVLRKNPGDRFMAGSLGFSAGVMLYVSFMEILPKGFAELTDAWGEGWGQWGAVGAFFFGIAVIAIIDRLVPEPINPHERGIGADPVLDARRRRLMKMGAFTAVAIAIHNFPEGFATFIAGLEDPEVAIAVAVAIAIHNIPEGVAVAVPIREATGSRAKAFTWSLLSGLAEPAGALIGFLLFMPLLGPVALGIAFAAVAGVMVFICLDELLPTAQATGRHHTAVYGLILGMAVMALSLLMLT
ncbi:zinc transporter ZupT [Corynebacterium testudinoris]|uniref:Zinc transporter ZupT n=1 Tax=Corynebacterium testudinoris TaxID=136857 RepID=A0A0G3HB29_9CORY|nr:zinc transporter ZupT [Corynebacterium testudinoris]AKK08382.1 putative divalent heavy-metal cations transporter [Corynebacterium testudinoris]MBX8994594.1 zinc transporter ZupT [Corynebacterium testudinoris]